MLILKTSTGIRCQRFGNKYLMQSKCFVVPCTILVTLENMIKRENQDGRDSALTASFKCLQFF